MRFLVDADLPLRTTEVLRAKGHEALDVRTTLAPAATDGVIASFVQAHGLCLLTGDFGFADVRNYPPEQYAGLMVLELPRDATEPIILKLVEDLLAQPEILSRLPGRLAIVAFGRVRLRPG